MIKLIKKYENKIIMQGLSRKEDIVFGALDDITYWNRNDKKHLEFLNPIIDSLSINSILLVKPEKELWQLIQCLISEISPGECMVPEDTETRTFLHSIPVSKANDPEHTVELLKKHKTCIDPEKGILTYGTISPEQAFVSLSSVCFACFVKFYVDLARKKIEKKSIMPSFSKAALSCASTYKSGLEDKITEIHLSERKCESPDEVIRAMINAGDATVKSGLVDSFFGNISYRFNNDIYISQTGSSLDELADHIDICPIDNSKNNAITASSEYSAHRSLYLKRPITAILHGHPRFSVIQSMLCDEKDCPFKDRCHTHCEKKRDFKGIPIICGEVGTGPTGLATTLPKAPVSDSVIVYGHGVFTTGKDQFSGLFKAMSSIEIQAINDYIEKYL